MSRQNGYAAPQIALHWIVAALIFAAFFTHDDMGKALRARLETGDTSTPIHVWLGVAALIFVVVRVVARRFYGAPPQPAGTHAHVERAAAIGHGLLYVLMIAAPVLGGLAWYAGLREVGDIHEIVGKALFILALAHGAVAIAHAVFKKDGVLTRMLRPAD